MAGKKTMRAVQYESYGGGAAGLKHVEVAIPSAKKGEILLKLEAASINPFDWKLQKGMMRPFLPPKFPFIPAMDVAGEVIELGPGVNSFRLGDKVIAMLNLTTGGGLAEYAVSPAALTVSRPPNVSAAEGAALPGAALTALQSLKSAGIKFGGGAREQPKNILVTAASGGVGHYSVQLAKMAGLHVTATCGARNAELVKRLGADEVLDYKTPEGAVLRSPSGRKYGAVIHCATGIAWPVFEDNLSDEAKVIDMTPTVKAMALSLLKKVTFSKKRLVPLFLVPKEEDLKFVAGLAAEGKIKSVIDSKHPLSKAEEAWTKSMEGHATGKIIVEM